MDTSEIEQRILKFFGPIEHIVCIALFGSHAQGVATRSSDVDIAVLFERVHIPDVLTLVEWREDLSALLETDVDLICLNTASPIIGMQVYKNGKNLKIFNEKEFNKYQMQLFYDYAELKEIRAPMENSILKRDHHD